MDRLAVVRERLYRQRLAADRFDDPADAVRWLGAMQAQEFAEAKWSVGARTAGAVESDVERAFASGAILRTHVLRPTWHFVAAADIRWILRLTAPRVRALNRHYNKKFGLDDVLLGRSREVLADTLEDGEPRTRTVLADALAGAGIEAEGPRLAYILMDAELDGLVCSGPRAGRQHTYALLADRAPDAEDLTDDAALAELTRRYFRSRGPATLRDFATWSSLRTSDARAGIESAGDELERTEDDDGTTWFAAPGAGEERPATGAFLVPMYDEIVMGYRDLKVVLAREPPREGLLSRPIVIDGRTVGSWKRTVTKREARIEATMFAALDHGERQALEDVVRRFGDFYGTPGVLVEQPAGS